MTSASDATPRAVPSYARDELPAATRHQQNGRSQLATWVTKLSSLDADERAQAKTAILRFAGETADSRGHVVEELLKIAVAKSGTDEFIKSHARFLEWAEATELIGTLRATEGLDVLIECLNCNNGMTGLSPARYPATKAVIKIGDAAVPKLAEALKNKPPGVRFMAAQALYAIGGEQARAALKQSLPKEKNIHIARMMKDMLRDWDGSGKYEF